MAHHTLLIIADTTGSPQVVKLTLDELLAGLHAFLGDTLLGDNLDT